MTKQTEALKLALEALVRADRISRYPNNKDAITAIREALAEQQQAGHTFYDGNGNVVAHLDATSEITMDYTKPSAWNYKETGRNGIYTPEQHQEPVAWITKNGKGWLRWHKPEDSEKNKDSIPLYKAPARKPWVGLTEEEIQPLLSQNRFAVFALVRAIEAKLKDKNGY